MRIGFIGAGKAAFSVGKHLTEHKIPVAGYTCRSAAHAQEAADFTSSKEYKTVKNIVEDCDVLCFAVSDDAISSVWEQAKDYSCRGKILIHFSGSLSSAVFDGAESLGAYAYSVHPMTAISDKYNSYKDLEDAFITIEGSDEYLEKIRSKIKELGHTVAVIKPEDKVRYHAASVMASNLAIGLFNTAIGTLVSCGFTYEDALHALGTLALGNMKSVSAKGPVEALTGPIERCDYKTVKKHVEALCGREKEIYISLSKAVLDIAMVKHPETDFSKIKEIVYE